MMISNSTNPKIKIIRLYENEYQGNTKSPYFDILDAFFKSKKPTGATSMRVLDEVTKQIVNSDDYYYNMGYIYDGFGWHKKDLYHFYKYNMPLSQEFIDYVLDQYKQGKFCIKKQKRRRFKKSGKTNR